MTKGTMLFAACILIVLSTATVAIADWESPSPRESHTAVLNTVTGSALVFGGIAWCWRG